MVQSQVSHTGIVEGVADGCVSVRILQTSACAACKVAGHCNAAEAKEKMVDVWCADAARYTVGQQVTVAASMAVARKALVLGFVMPFLLVVAVLVTVLYLTKNEGLAALAALGSLVPYYLLLWWYRDRIQRDITFRIIEERGKELL